MKKSIKIANKKMEAILNTRVLWAFSPVARIKESAKRYSRKNYKISKDFE